MNMTDLFENQQQSDYMNLDSGVFAYALWIVYGKPANGKIGIVVSRDYPKSKKPSKHAPPKVAHAFYLDENSANGIDEKGNRPIWQICKDFPSPYNNVVFHSQYAPDEFLGKFIGSEKQLRGDEKDIQMAVQFIQSKLDIYKP